MSASNARQGILSLAVKDKAALYSAYMPFVKNGGIVQRVHAVREERRHFRAHAQALLPG